MPRHVPFISQYSDLPEETWRKQCCGIACLKMILDYWHALDPNNRTASYAELFQEALEQGAYLSGIGWKHKELVSLAERYGYKGYNVDAPSVTLDALFHEFSKELQYFPVIASVWARYDPDATDGHLIIVAGVQDESVFVNDPMYKQEKDGVRIIPKETFLKGFKKRYIVVYPTQHGTEGSMDTV